MKVFVDTNVLASAFGARGLCADALNVILTSHHLVVSRQVLTELRRALSSKFHVPPATADAAVTFLENQTVVSKTGKTHPSLKKKLMPDDRQIVSDAIAAQVDVFVTGDKEILAESLDAPIRILSVRDFWELEAKNRS